ncbi:MAG: hypothetical protein HIU82_15820 [Proteobacteria bacterium]|nr:hypothetical protein [Pseudomonadota bacterium]
MTPAPASGDAPATHARAALRDPVAEQLVHAAQAAETATRALDKPSLDEEDRSWIARLVLRSFTATVMIYLLFLGIQGIVPGASPAIATQAEDMIKSIVVPIVTLVLGYYFGQSRKD